LVDSSHGYSNAKAFGLLGRGAVAPSPRGYKYPFVLCGFSGRIEIAKFCVNFETVMDEHSED